MRLARQTISDLDPSPAHESAFMKLLAKRPEYLLDYREPSDKVLAAMSKLTDVEFRERMKLDISLSINKKTPDTAGLMTKMMEAYNAMRKTERTLPFQQSAFTGENVREL